MDWALNNLQRLICRKTQPTNQPSNMPFSLSDCLPKLERPHNPEYIKLIQKQRPNKQLYQGETKVLDYFVMGLFVARISHDRFMSWNDRRSGKVCYYRGSWCTDSFCITFLHLIWKPHRWSWNKVVYALHVRTKSQCHRSNQKYVVTRLVKKFRFGYLNLNDHARSGRPRIMDPEAVLRVIKANPGCSICRV